MYTFLTRNGQTIAFLVGLLIVVAAIVTIVSGVGDWELIADDDPSRYDTTIFNLGMYAAIGLVIVCFIAAVLFGLLQLASDPKGAMKGIIGLAVIVGVFFVVYSSADPSVPMDGLLTEFGVSDGASKMISGAMWTALGLAVLAVLALAISEILNFFR